MKKFKAQNNEEISFKVVAKSISDELINMRTIVFISGGDKAVDEFDKILKIEIPLLQIKLMDTIKDA